MLLKVRIESADSHISTALSITVGAKWHKWHKSPLWSESDENALQETATVKQTIKSLTREQSGNLTGAWHAHQMFTELH